MYGAAAVVSRGHACSIANGNSEDVDVAAPRLCNPIRRIAAGVLLAGSAGIVGAQAPASGTEDPRALEQIVIVAPYGATEIERDRVPSYVQSAVADQIESAQSLDLTDFLNRNFASVNINHAQNNPLQPDFNFRGFTASPLLGLPQGLAVYENGVRMNEPFGDTVSWDLIPLSAVQGVQLLAGSNPVFGLNSLGGALSLQMKDGFTFDRTTAEVYGGSFSRRGATLQHGGNEGPWGYYADIDYFEEAGWRDYSRSDALRFFGSVSRQGESSRLDVSAAFADSKLRGNGASPAELLEIDRAQVFTHPDITENSLGQLIVQGSIDVSAGIRLAGNAYYRAIDTDTFNGDGTIFEPCEFGQDEFLVEEDFEDLNADGECAADADAGIALVRDSQGHPIGAELDGTELDAINNVGRRRQESWGASLQLAFKTDLGADRRNDLTVGMAASDGATSFGSVVEVAHLLENRGTSRTGIFADEFRTQVDSTLTTWSRYFVDTFDVSGRVSLMASGRYDDTRVRLADRSGQSPELSGNHQFSRFNPALGISLRLTPAAVVDANVAQSTRAPTPVELACASEGAPCNLPTDFLPIHRSTKWSRAASKSEPAAPWQTMCDGMPARFTSSMKTTSCSRAPAAPGQRRIFCKCRRHAARRPRARARPTSRPRSMVRELQPGLGDFRRCLRYQQPEPSGRWGRHRTAGARGCGHPRHPTPSAERGTRLRIQQPPHPGRRRIISAPAFTCAAMK